MENCCGWNYNVTELPIFLLLLCVQRLIVCLEEALYIHNIKDMKLLKSLLSTPPNPKGLCALSVSHSSSYLAYPGSFTAGEITLYDVMNLNTVAVISAHASHVAAIAFNASGTNLASASEKGTVIRVFSVPDGVKLFEFCRGVKRLFDGDDETHRTQHLLPPAQIQTLRLPVPSQVTVRMQV